MKHYGVVYLLGFKLPFTRLWDITYYFPNRSRRILPPKSYYQKENQLATKHKYCFVLANLFNLSLIVSTVGVKGLKYEIFVNEYYTGTRLINWI